LEAVEPARVFGQSAAVSAGPADPYAEEAALAAAARDGDRAAFGLLYGRFSRMVHGILLARVPRRDVDDLVHDVFVVALRRLQGLREPRAIGPWLAMIARNRATDYHRRSAGTAELPEPDDLPGDVHPEGEAMHVLAAIRALPEAYREPLILRLVEGMTGPEIAERTGLTPGSVRVNLHRGLQQLRGRLVQGERP
jgi:RNA polymerase sigma-70 factor, ECF subfamily